jgi:hypothetical protein
MAEDFADDIHRHNEMIQALYRVWTRQGEINEELRTFNKQQVEINQDIKTTLARLETTIARMIERGTNGRDA